METAKLNRMKDPRHLRMLFEKHATNTNKLRKDIHFSSPVSFRLLS